MISARFTPGGNVGREGMAPLSAGCTRPDQTHGRTCQSPYLRALVVGR